MMAYKSSCSSEKYFHGQGSVYDGGLTFAQPAPVPPVSLLNGKAWIAGLCDGAMKHIEAANVMLLPGSLAQPVI
jgi:hypothetical protein